MWWAKGTRPCSITKTDSRTTILSMKSVGMEGSWEVAERLRLYSLRWWAGGGSIEILN